MSPTTWGRKVVYLSFYTIPTEPFVQEQLIDVFKSVGQVVGFRSVSMLSLACTSAHINSFFRLVFDRETGKPRGYGFCEFAGTSNSFFLFVRLDGSLTSNWLFSAIPPNMCFSTRPLIHPVIWCYPDSNLCFRFFALCLQDHETAASAVRNLNNADVGGRPLRIDLADSDPFLEGKTTVRGELLDGSDPRGRWRDHREHQDRDRDRYDNLRDQPKSQDPNSFLSSLPPGVPIAPGSTALDTISQTLATMSPAQLVEVLAQMKVCCGSHRRVTQN